MSLISPSSGPLIIISSSTRSMFPFVDISEVPTLLMLILISVVVLRSGSSFLRSTSENFASLITILSTSNEIGRAPLASPSSADLASTVPSFLPMSSKLNLPSLSRQILTSGETSFISSMTTCFERSGKSLNLRTNSLHLIKSFFLSASFMAKSFSPMPVKIFMSISPISTFLFRALSAAGTTNALTLSGVM
ncbi:hypothetical protein BMS3Bbin09_01177 [bacterium BMS3Bbin09]|nr:hypothetical protein BMS3Bbin09_01177 [bacterium BMS3Bbin09]